MENDKLATLSMDFEIAIVKLAKRLKEKHENVISNQILRSGTSIGANIREAKYAHSRADFIVKMQIALKEANETDYWLELLFRTDHINELCYKELSTLCSKIRRYVLISSINTAKLN